MNLALLSAIRLRGLRQWQVAARAGLSESVLSRLINNRIHPAAIDLAHKRRIARVLGRPLGRLFPKPRANSRRRNLGQRTR